MQLKHASIWKLNGMLYFLGQQIEPQNEPRHALKFFTKVGQKQSTPPPVISKELGINQKGN